MKFNKKYKNSVFIELFNNKEKIIELYGAIEGKAYPCGTEIQINTLQDILFLDRINDISFTIEDKLVVLIEHQSTINKNMPLRCLLYIARLYEKILDNRNIYKRNLIKIPTPEFIVLYNGAEDFPDKQRLKLSDAFKMYDCANREIELELTVKILNINKGHNNEITQRSQTLNDYVSFIDKIRENQKTGMTLSGAVTEAIKFCVKTEVLRDFLETNGSEVTNMLYTEFNMDDALEVAREEGIEQVVIEMKRKNFTDDIISDISKLPIEKIKEIVE